jgi:hypothetical protein
MNAASRRKVLQWLLAFTDFQKFDATARAPLLDSSDHVYTPLEMDHTCTGTGKSREVNFEDTAARNMDHRILCQALDVLCFRILKVRRSV